MAQRQIGATLGEGECVFAQAFTPTATEPRLSIPLPQRKGVAAWQVLVMAWPLAAAAANVTAFALVNWDQASAATLLNFGGAPRGGTPLSPGQADSHVVRADRDVVTVDARGVDAALTGDAAVTLEVEVHALYATPKCPEVLPAECEDPKQRGCG